MDANEAGHQKRIYVSSLQHTVVWDGIATENAALVESPDVFTYGREPFKRILPTVVSGEPVPPPYYTVFFRFRKDNSDESQILDEARTRIYVPQVVKIEMTAAAYQEFCRPVIFPESDWAHEIDTIEDILYVGDPLFYYGCTNMTHAQVEQNIALKCQSFIPNDVNLLFTSQPVKGRTKRIKAVLVKELNKEVLNSFGFTPSEHVSWRNQKPYGVAYVYMDILRKEPCFQKIFAEGRENPPNSYDPSLFPFNHMDLLYAVALVSTHETGHTLGLVNHLLYGAKDNHNIKRLTGNGDMIMDRGRLRSQMQRFGKSSVPSTWTTRNHYYLRFILPKIWSDL
jgi:hypothetical protein